MTLRHIAAWLSGVALVGAGATLLCAQSPQPLRESPSRIGRDQLRAEIIKLRTEVEMLRLDYELARDGLLEEVKIVRGLRMAASIRVVETDQGAGAEPPAIAPKRESEHDRQNAAEAAKAGEQEAKQAEEEDAVIIAEGKKKLARQFALLAERRLDLEDAERNYRENSPSR